MSTLTKREAQRGDQLGTSPLTPGGSAYNAQISALKRDVSIVNRQLEFEIERRKEVMKLIDNERQDVVPDEHLTAVVRRDEEIRAIRDEKEAMLEWLQRGVNEAQKMSMSLESMRAAHRTAMEQQSDLANDKKRLIEMERRLTLEIEDAKQKIHRIEETRSVMTDHTEQQKSLLHLTRDITVSTQADLDRLTAELDRLQTRARDLETVEIATGCMAASVRRCLHTLESLNDAISKGVLMEDLADDDGYDSDTDADSTRSAAVILSSTKSKIGRVDALLLTLRSVLKRYDQDIASRASHAAAVLHAEKSQFVRERDALLTEMSRDVSQLRQLSSQREEQLRRALDLHNKATSVYVSDPSGEGSKPFSLIDYYHEDNARMIKLKASLSQDNAQLLAKVQERTTDYDAIRELRREFHDLESRRMVLSSSLKQSEGENTELRHALFELEVSLPLKQKARPPWKSVPMT